MSAAHGDPHAVAGRGGRVPLALAGAISAAIALLHLGMIPFGARAYRWFGAGESFARKAEAGSFVPALVTAFIALVFAGFAWYGLAGAGRIARPPWLRAGLAVISAIYLLRGVLAIPQGVMLSASPGHLMPRFFAFSVVALVAGLCHAIGTTRAWQRLGAKDDQR